MPLFKRKPFERLPPPEGLKDTEEIYYLELSKEAFRRYEEYFERMMLLNSTVWSCALTSRPNLTFSEAIECEKKARKILRTMNVELKAPIVIIANATKCSSITEMVDEVFNFMNVRYFKEEICYALETTSDGQKIQREVQVLSVIGSKTTHDPDKIKYRVKRVDTNKTTAVFTVTNDEIHRKRTVLSKEKLKLFLKQCVEASETGQLKIKDDVFKKQVTDAGVDGFADIFPGPPPQFEMSKGLATKIERVTKGNSKQKKSNGKDGKQTSISKYLTKTDGKQTAESKESKAKREQEQLRLKAEAERKAELEKQQAEENKRKRVEMQQMAMSTYHSFNQIKDDLELRDQKRIVPSKPVKTLIPVTYFGDALMVLEFIYSFADRLEDKDKFPKGYSLDLLERSLLCREVAGPLSDIIQVLMSTLFALQIEEANEVEISFVYDKPTEVDEPVGLAISEATKAANWISTYLIMSINELPMDATTVSEVLRMHLLMSGASVNETATKWRFQHRGGYANEDDPGLTLRLRKPHIIRALSHHSVYELPLIDILSILKCLVDQILTYSTVRDTVEERLEKSSKARTGLKTLYSNERKNKANLIAAKKRLVENTKKSIEECEASDKTADEKTKFKDDANRALEKETKVLEANYEREKKGFEKSIETLKQDVFQFQQCLGSDRAYRMYWLFESLPGLFIEHQPFGGQCFENPVENIHELANCASADRFSVVKTMVSNQYYGNDKENEIDNYLTKKKNGTNVKVADDPSIIKNEPVKWSQADLLMCTGDSSTCPVHPKFDPKRSVWSFLHTEEELNALIESLNPKGIREKGLRDNLESEKELILNHIKDCPFDKLQIDPVAKDGLIEDLHNMKTYKNANMNFPKGTEITLIVEAKLVEAILEMEMNVQTGHLGSIKVKDRLAWREALEKFEYDKQCDELVWGPDDQFHEGKKMLNGTSETPDSTTKKIVFDDLTSLLGNTTDIDLDASIDDCVSVHTSSQMQAKVHGYASALLQIALGVEPVFLKPPFGYLKELKDKQQQQQVLKTGRQNLEMWCVSLMKATSFSQVFLQYNILHDSVKWHKSSLNATCIFCRRRSEPDKMLLCDGCNAGKHLFCFKPKLTKVPEEDWFCEKCKPPEKKAEKKGKAANKRKIFKDDSDDSHLTSSESEEDDDEEGAFYRLLTPSDGEDQGTCTACNKPGLVLQSCETCYREVHLACAKPPLKIRSKKWHCHLCKGKSDFKQLKAEATRNKSKTKKRKLESDNPTDSDDSDEAIAVKVRRLEKKKDPDDEIPEKESKTENGRGRRSSRRTLEPEPTESSNSRRNSRRIEEDDSTKTNGTTRRSRRAGDDLLLDNVLLYGLLTDIKNHKDSWPFDRPVNKAEVPDYYNVIQRPMDFAKIKSKLNLGEYSSNYDFMSDIQLVFTNCDLYNTSGSEIYQSGVNLEKFIQKRCAELNLPFSRSDMISDASEPKRKSKKT
ncbi:hypothetical protein HA402_002396 [Bradysia odoriphaga]|nr:hypothetical protein HA402_002396 [Bradysia odoriphaga]